MTDGKTRPTPIRYKSGATVQGMVASSSGSEVERRAEADDRALQWVLPQSQGGPPLNFLAAVVVAGLVDGFGR